MERQVLQHLIEHCTKQMRHVEEQLPTGFAKDMGEYQKMCGKHFAYMEMRTTLGDMLQRITRGEEE